MTPAFGFSVGDFISVINLIRKISKALKETGGATAEYQDAIIELKGLKHALQHLEALEPTEDNIRHVNAIRGMALACQLPLRDFMTELEKYETSLGPWSDRTSFRKAGRQTKWAVSFGQEVKKLRALVAAKLMSINLLLATVSSQAVSSMSVRAKRDHGDLISKIAEQRAALHQVHGKVEHIQDRIKSMEATSQTKLDAISSKSDATQTSVMNLRGLAQQVVATVGAYSQDIRGLLYNIMQADGRTYRAILQIQERLAQSPSSLLDSNIQFTNALGEYRELPYEYFCHWEPFEGFLRAQFKDKPGQNKILDGRFHIIDLKSPGTIVKKEHWSRSISQGAMLTMSMIMSHLRGKTGQCPRPGCTGVGTRECEAQSQLICGMCYLNFSPTSDGLEDVLRNVTVSEEDIARQQVEEDLRMYGSRPNPSDAIDVDENTKPADLPPKRKASEFEAAVDRPAKVRARRESQNLNYETVTAVDCNSGASPLDVWLNQSALPSTALDLENPVIKVSEEDLVAQEEEEIKFFRNVHMAMLPTPKEDETTADALEGLEFGAQIYCRNIRDRYPLLPSYLNRRLAQANFRRSERLRNEGLKVTQPVPLDNFQPQPFADFRSNADVADTSMVPVGFDVPTPNESGGEERPRTTDDGRHRGHTGPIIRTCDRSERIRKTSKELLLEIDINRMWRYRDTIKVLLRLVQRRIQGFLAEWSLSDFETMKSARSGLLTALAYSRMSILRLSYIQARYSSIPEQLETNERTPRQLDKILDMVDVNKREFAIEMMRKQVTEKEEIIEGIIKQSWDTVEKHTDINCLIQQMKNNIAFLPPDYHIRTRIRAPSLTEYLELDGDMKENQRIQPYQSAYTDFWTGGTRTHSSGSSMNSSLRGRPTFDPQEQNPVFPTDCQSGSSASLVSSPALPPPPVELGKVLTFNCDICGQNVQVKRRLEWQKHVMSDLRPYVCTLPDCTTPEQLYSSRSSFLNHERLHKLGKNLKNIFVGACLFCGEMLSKANLRERAEHVGRHMEEIAFSVVTKPYEDWDFYTESSRKSKMEID